MSSVRLKAFPPQKIQTFRLIAEQVGKFWIKCVEAIGPLVGANKDGGRLELPEGGVDEPNLQGPLLGRFRKVVAEVEISQLRAGSALLTKHRRLPQQSAHVPFLRTAARLDFAPEVSGEHKSGGKRGKRQEQEKRE